MWEVVSVYVSIFIINSAVREKIVRKRARFEWIRKRVVTHHLIGLVTLLNGCEGHPAVVSL